MAIGLDLGLDDDFGLPRFGSSRKRKKTPVLTPEVEESLLGQIGRKSLGGVAAVGNALDLPGSMVRDVLAWENPFDQLLSPFSDENRTDGRELLRNYGLAGKKDTWGNWAAGFATETLLDPTTYLTFGGSALTKGGRVAKAAGLLDDVAKATGKGVGRRVGQMSTSLDDLIASVGGDAAERVAESASKMGLDLAEIGSQKLGTFGRVELPFTNAGFNFGGEGSRLAMGLAGGLDTAGLALNKSLPIRLARAAFDPAVGGKVGYADQQVAKEAYKLNKEAQRVARKSRVDVLDAIEEGHVAFDDTYGDFINTSSANAFEKFKSDLVSAGNLNPDETDVVAKLWKSWSEGYLGEDFAATAQKRLAGITRDGVVPNEALAQSAPEFYSKLARVVEAKMPNVATWDQLKATLKNNGVKDEEIRDMGIEAAFGGKKLTKKELMDHLSENAVTVEEAVRHAPTDDIQALRGELDSIYQSLRNPNSLPPGEAERLVAREAEILDSHPTVDMPSVSYAEHSIPGGSNYKEILLKSALKSGHMDYGGSHWFDSNVVAHIRADDVVLPDGNKMLRIQEIQSDWHQAGKKMGYGPPKIPELIPSPSGNAYYNDLAKIVHIPTNGKWRLDAGSGMTSIHSSLEEATSEYSRIAKNVLSRAPSIPDGPFKDSWRQLAVKKVLRYAAEKGYDSVGIVDGEDIATAVGGPASELRTFYNDILTGDFKKLTKKGYVGEVEVPGAAGAASKIQGATYSGKTQVFQLADDLRKTILEEGQPLYQKANGAIKGAVDFGKDGKAMLYTFRETDVSTHVHELGHVMRRHLTDADNATANKFVGATDATKWTVEQEEKWARGFEKYLREGKAPNSALGEIFSKLKEWMTGIYQSIVGTELDVKLSPEIKDLYGKLVGTQPKVRPAQAKSYDQFEKLVRLTTELDGDVDKALQTLMPGASPVSDGLAANVRTVARDMREVQDGIHTSIISKGGKRGTIDDIGATEGASAFSYATRYSNLGTNPKTAGKVLKTADASSQSRNAVIRAIPTEYLNQLLTDPAARGDNAAEYILNKIGDRLDEGFEEGAGKAAHAKAVADWVEGMPTGEVFTNRYSDDWFKYIKSGYTVDSSLDAIHETIRQNLDAGDGVEVSRVFKNANMETDKALEHLASLTGRSVDELSKATIPVDVANAVISMNKVFDQPEWSNEMVKSIDKFNTWFKQAVTMPFPSNWVRNFTSGQYVNMAFGNLDTPQDVAKYGGKVLETSNLIRNGVPKKLMQELEVEGVIDTRFMSEGVESAGHGFTATGPSNPLWINQTFGKARQDVMESPSRIDIVPGAKAARAAWGTAIGTGEKASAIVEFMNRVPMYLYLKEKGLSPKMAAERVRELHVDYSDLAPFEKQVMRRLVPFFSWNRKIAPVIIQTLADRPGGALGQTIQLNNDLRGQDATTPDYVANSMSIPLGEQPDGSQRYITGFGLPYEQLFAFGDGGVQGALREGLSQTTPLLKAPLEWATGQSFFQAGPSGAGRPLEELDPTIGRTLANLTREPGSDPVALPTAFEFLFANSPASRLGTVARQVTDTRKGPLAKATNLLTGARVTDVPVAQQEGMLADRANTMMRDLGASSYENVYFSDRDKAGLDPDQLQQIEEFELLKKVLASRRQRRAKEKEKAARSGK